MNSKKSLILAHGWAMNSHIWDDFIQPLSDNFEITCLNFPSHFQTLEEMSDFFVEHCTQKSIWLGWSLGATVILDIAKRHPECVESLILVAGNPCFVEKETWFGVKKSVFSDFSNRLNDDIEKTLTRFMALQVQGSENAKLNLLALKNSFSKKPIPSLKTLQIGLEILFNIDFREVFSNLAVPVKIILGQNDALIPAEVGEQLKKLLPSANVDIIAQAGHVPFLSHSQQVQNVIVEFVDTHD